MEIGNEKIKIFQIMHYYVYYNIISIRTITIKSDVS